MLGESTFAQATFAQAGDEGTGPGDFPAVTLLGQGWM